ncbi:helix-turn-helix domain-containing protein [Enterococcus thailandicus]|uniref:helix-turn-helix domain-containing protein n=1 Tax=Enterococcus thailandicus TaxID=417368 RepID=UPI0022DF7892|nr:helix-turn-helix transcriptional regulator [Enterococcus thailandicus]
MKNILGSVIKNIRKSKGLTQSELSNLTGFSQNTISNHENMKRSLDELDINIYAKALNVTPQYLFEQANGKNQVSYRDLEDNNKAELLSIYSKLNTVNQKATYDFAKQKLDEQNKIVSLNTSDDEIFTLAAHSKDPKHIHSDEEISEINDFLDEIDKKYDDKHKK